jgi:hypothetical protein
VNEENVEGKSLALHKVLLYHLQHLARTCQMLQYVWQELDYRIDICRLTKVGHIEHLQGRTENWSVSLSLSLC